MPVAHARSVRQFFSHIWELRTLRASASDTCSQELSFVASRLYEKEDFPWRCCKKVVKDEEDDEENELCKHDYSPSMTVNNEDDADYNNDFFSMNGGKSFRHLWGSAFPERVAYPPTKKNYPFFLGRHLPGTAFALLKGHNGPKDAKSWPKLETLINRAKSAYSGRFRVTDYEFWVKNTKCKMVAKIQNSWRIGLIIWDYNEAPRLSQIWIIQLTITRLLTWKLYFIWILLSLRNIKLFIFHEWLFFHIWLSPWIWMNEIGNFWNWK